jgi:hypothetical protein
MLNATRGRYPKSSSSVNSGKKIAIGGNMTATTQAVARYVPSINNPSSHQGMCSHAAPDFNNGWPVSINSQNNQAEGTLVPITVSQSTTANMAIIMGNPVQRLVSSQSNLRSQSVSPGTETRRTQRSAIRAASV